MHQLKLVQLPVPPPSAFAATGNVPLASGSLAVSMRYNGLESMGIETEVLSPNITDTEGDTRLADRIAKDEPDFVGFSLYLWNSERSLHIAREVKKRSPNSKIFIGGPEVNPDNTFLLEESGYDIAVVGEAEETFARILKSLLNKEDIYNINGISIRDKLGKMSPFTPIKDINFPINQYPSPYLEGFIPLDPQRSTYLETVRGCKSECAYCFYPRSSNVLRTLDVKESLNLVKKLKDLGAKELVFLDPTFNHRPNFEQFLNGLIEINSDKQFQIFAELRAEGINSKIANKLGKAGFHRIELGMQSVNKETLKKVKRHGSPEKVAEAAKMLAKEGIDLLLDLIVGLPGDKPEDVMNGINFFIQHGLEDWVQIFPLSVLPGTFLRTEADKENLKYDPKPPYRVISTPFFSQKSLIETLLEAEYLLGNSVDEFPRPFLVDPEPNSLDSILVDLDSNTPTNQYRIPGYRHIALWFYSENLDTHKERILEIITFRLNLDPYSVLDIILRSANPFSIQLLDSIRILLSKATSSYLKKSLLYRGEDMQHRINLCLPQNNYFSKQWKKEILEIVPTFEDTDFQIALENCKKLGVSIPMARIINPEIPENIWKQLKKKADPETITFANRKLEQKWTIEGLNYGEQA